MPSALLKQCAGPGCPNLVEKGRCPGCARSNEQRRGSATARGYDSHWTRVFRPRFIRLLLDAGIVPVCGAAMPGGPLMRDSTCRARGILNAQDLALDHDPPLRDDERHDRRAVEDPLRVGLLCRADHARKTQREYRS